MGERQAGARLEIGVGVERLGEDTGRRRLAIGAAEDQPEGHAVALDEGKRLLAMMLEARRGVFLSLWQSDPGLDAEQAVRRLVSGGARPLGVGDAAPRHHPVDRARQNDLVRAQAVAVLELAAEEVGDRRKADMGMRADVDALARDELHRSHLVEEDERPDHLPLRRGKRAANLEVADVARPRHDQGLDRLDQDKRGPARGSSSYETSI